MDDNKEFELNLSDETMQKLETFADKNGKSPEEVAEFIIFEFLRNQIHVIEKRSEETGVPVDELVNMQFSRILTYLAEKESN
jgi:hypothetical protein